MSYIQRFEELTMKLKHKFGHSHNSADICLCKELDFITNQDMGGASHKLLYEDYKEADEKEYKKNK